MPDDEAFRFAHGPAAMKTVPPIVRSWLIVVAAMIFAACYVIYVNHLITLESLVKPFGMR